MDFTCCAVYLQIQNLLNGMCTCSYHFPSTTVHVLKVLQRCNYTVCAGQFISLVGALSCPTERYVAVLSGQDHTPVL